MDWVQYNVTKKDRCANVKKSMNELRRDVF